MTDSQKETIAKLTDAEVLDITIFDGQTQLSELGGGRATISVNYPLKPGQSEQGVAARYVAEDGRVTEQPVRYTGQTAAFTITHCSVYVISYDEGRAARACPRDESCPMAAFRDTDRNAWYHDGVHWALKNGVMNGVSDSEFDPAGLTTRAMLIMMLWRLEGEPSASFELHFRDVSEGQWYTDAVRWAASTGVVSGYSDTEFGPEDTLTREQLAGILYRYAQYKGLSADEDTSLGGYKDASQVGDWAVPAMSWAVGAGIINGVEENALAPTDGASRSQVATVLMRCSALH